MRIAITGASGLIGTALRQRLSAEGHAVVPIVRGEPAPGEIGWDPAAGRLVPADLAGLDAVVNLAGEGIGEKRWTPEQKRRIVDSRVRGTALLSEAIAAADDRPSVLLSGSAVGYYGKDRGGEAVTESSGPGDDFLARLCVDWEAATALAREAGVRVAHLRTGVVLDRSGGVLPRMALPIRLGVGGRIGSGRQWISWITLADHVAATSFLLEHDVRGPVNLTAPEPVTNERLTKALGAELHRPTVLPAPAFALRLALGRERADNLVFASQRVLPKALQDAGFAFTQPVIGGALQSVLS
ncbi:MAG TPA: TIGR01777 family oxidoreductase [Acidimicrobiales bacterium]|nr:TIGR01777 family oxidoreductase [Acidimicrobiales bacterium]